MIKLKTLREQFGISQNELSKQLNVSRSTISMWENGLSSPSIKDLTRLANFFHISVDELIDKNHHPCYSKYITNNIKSLRLSKGLTQSELASHIGIPQNVLSNWEQLKYEPDIPSLIIISDYFNCSIDYILNHKVRNSLTFEEIIAGFLEIDSKKLTPDIIKELKDFASFITR